MRERAAGRLRAARAVVRMTAVAAGGVLLAACASTEKLATEYPGPRPFPAASLQTYCHEHRPWTDEFELLSETDDYRVHQVTMRLGGGHSDADADADAGTDAGDEIPITFEFYEQKSPGPVPVAVLLPILNGQKDVMRPFAKHFASNGYGVVIVDTTQRKTLLEDIVDPEPAIRLTIDRHRRVLDWVEARADLDNSRIGVFGASLGGFNALFVTAFDSRVSVLSVALVGGSVADVMVRSDEGRIVRSVTGARERLGMTNAELRDYLAEKIETDTLSVAPYLDAGRVLLVLARFDDAVPYELQRDLREAMGRPKSITVPTGHATAALYLFYLRARVLEFFDATLSRPGIPVSTAPLPDVCRERWQALHPEHATGD